MGFTLAICHTLIDDKKSLMKETKSDSGLYKKFNEGV